jgi:PKHD-type hydroxylase
MLIKVKGILPPEAVAKCRKLLEQASWADGKHTAGTQAAQVKNNQQLPEDVPELEELRSIVGYHIQKSGLFFTAALPKRVFPPLFNKYSGESNSFGNHVDNAIRTFVKTWEHIRTDVSCTVFLSNPDEYEGGELEIEDTYGTNSVKLDAGDAILYPATSLHRVNPVTKGARLASFFWVESMVRENEHRRILFDMDTAIFNLRETVGETEPVVLMTSCYHNLLRLWAET